MEKPGKEVPIAVIRLTTKTDGPTSTAIYLSPFNRDLYYAYKCKENLGLIHNDVIIFSNGSIW